jgi:hypothetical protein
MRPLPRIYAEHRAARAHRDKSSIRRENNGLCSVMAVGREQFVGSDLHRLQGLMRPLSLGLIGLAVAVAIWGFAYKLSLYQPHPYPKMDSCHIRFRKKDTGPRRPTKGKIPAKAQSDSRRPIRGHSPARIRCPDSPVG